jgi:DHA3 family tetracycline resistance protein-like MFS transporter
VLVGTALELSVFIFEVPTFVLADTYGRRSSVTLGFVLIGAGFSFEGAVPIFAVIWGVGYKFISGALQAWIEDEVGGRDLGRVYLRGERAYYLGSFVGVSARASTVSGRLTSSRTSGSRARAA